MSPVLLASGDEELNPLIPHTIEIIVGGIAFLLLLWVLKKFAFPLFEKTYAERTEAIEGGIKRAEVAQAEAAKALSQYQAALADARGEAAEIRTGAQAERTRIVDEARAEAAATAESVVSRAHSQIDASRSAAQLELSREVGRIALDLASRVVGEALEDDARARATVDRFIADLEAQAQTQGNGAQV